MSDLAEPALENVAVDAVFSALADPVRLTFVRALQTGGDWVCGSDILKAAGITIGRSTLSHHLKVLREAGLIHTRVHGTRRLVALRRDELKRRFPGLLEMLGEQAPAGTAGRTPTSAA